MKSIEYTLRTHTLFMNAKSFTSVLLINHKFIIYSLHFQIRNIIKWALLPRGTAKLSNELKL